MTSRTPTLWLLVALSACGPGSSSDTGSSSGSGSSSPESSSGGPTTGVTTSGGITGGPTEAGTTSTGTSSTGTSSTSEPSTSTTSTSSSSSSSSSGSSTGGSGGACVDVSGDYGPCEAIIGYGFDGTSCRAFSGCGCAPHCEDFAADPVACALGCAAAGECNEAAMHPAGINKDPVMEGSFCDQLDACTGDPESAAWLMQIFGKLTCEPANIGCDQGQSCTLSPHGTLDEPVWSQVCAASLLPGADLQCVVFGP